MKPITLEPHKFFPEENIRLEYGTYLVIRKDGKCHKEVYNGTGWAYNHKVIEWYYLPKID